MSNNNLPEQRPDIHIYPPGRCIICGANASSGVVEDVCSPDHLNQIIIMNNNYANGGSESEPDPRLVEYLLRHHDFVLSLPNYSRINRYMAILRQQVANTQIYPSGRCIICGANTEHSIDPDTCSPDHLNQLIIMSNRYAAGGPNPDPRLIEYLIRYPDFVHSLPNNNRIKRYMRQHLRQDLSQESEPIQSRHDRSSTHPFSTSSSSRDTTAPTFNQYATPYTELGSYPRTTAPTFNQYATPYTELGIYPRTNPRTSSSTRLPPYEERNTPLSLYEEEHINPRTISNTPLPQYEEESINLRTSSNTSLPPYDEPSPPPNRPSSPPPEYRNKYLKYKTRYLELKKQMGRNM